jgi:type IV pilus assembly protein PilM
VDDLGGLGGGFGAPQSADLAALSTPPAAMSDEEYMRTQITDAIMPVLHELATELRRSLDFYRNRANGLGAQQVVICGGTAKLPGLAEFLTANLEVSVAVGNPLQYLTAGSKADAQYLQDVGPFFPVSVGLAVRELMADAAPPRKKR